MLNGIQNYAMAHLDDICIFSESFEDHLGHIEEVIRRLSNSGLKANKSKCKFAMSKLKPAGLHQKLSKRKGVVGSWNANL